MEEFVPFAGMERRLENLEIVRNDNRSAMQTAEETIQPEARLAMQPETSRAKTTTLPI